LTTRRVPKHQSRLSNHSAGAMDQLPTAQHLSLPDADIALCPDFLPPIDSDRLLRRLRETTAWRQETITFGGKTTPLPRLTAWHGDSGRTYVDSKIATEPTPWTRDLIKIKGRIEVVTGTIVNRVLLSLYRDGRDGIAWHSDDAPELGNNPTIGTISLGETRRFMLRHTRSVRLETELTLSHGSLLVMAGPTQRFWQHQIPKTARDISERITLTFLSMGANES
jgi:alkylated DNA repair dioxygenase AlkB